ncbi:hypothetical protein DRO66_09890 [Candidatus Bathyarchaeota archaeon]|nr:MAG: hypothetical protein DRO66_09890 [Candidatus Bathyarchaeota archaeon]
MICVSNAQLANDQTEAIRDGVERQMVVVDVISKQNQHTKTLVVSSEYGERALLVLRILMS